MPVVKNPRNWCKILAGVFAVLVMVATAAMTLLLYLLFIAFPGVRGGEGGVQAHGEVVPPDCWIYRSDDSSSLENTKYFYAIIGFGFSELPATYLQEALEDPICAGVGEMRPALDDGELLPPRRDPRRDPRQGSARPALAAAIEEFYAGPALSMRVAVLRAR